jgi:hypothetical protein
MFASLATSPHTPPGSAVSTAELVAMVDRLRDAGCEAHDDAQRITLIELLETAKNVACAVQAQLTADFAASREEQLAQASTESVRERASRDIGAQIGLARRVSPRIGTRLVGLAKVLTAEMPHLNGALRQGIVDEYRALLVVAETATLTLEHRQTVDAELAQRYGTLTPRQARGAAAAIGYRLDPGQAVRRHRKAWADRCVTLRPAPDTMTYLTALLPAVDGVAAYAALTRYAASATAHGDPRGKGALMADEFRDRLLQPVATDSVAETACEPSDVEHLTDGLPGVPAGVTIEIQLVMTDRTLFDGDQEPATLTGYGPIPAPLARHLARTGEAHTTTWVRRLYTDAGTGHLTRADPRRRLFSPIDRQFLIARDQVCRTPWCGAPIRQADHTTPYAAGGLTDTANGAGLCAACNQTKEQPGWTSTPRPDGDIFVTTPTGHRYRSRPPDPPRSEPWNHHAA